MVSTLETRRENIDLKELVAETERNANRPTIDEASEDDARRKSLDAYATVEANYDTPRSSSLDFAASETIVVSTTPGAESDSWITKNDVAYVSTSFTATGSFSGSTNAKLTLQDAKGNVLTQFEKTVDKAGTFSWNEKLGTLGVGEYTLTLTVDYDSLYEESSEENNISREKFRVVNERPSLYVTTTKDVVDDKDGVISLPEAIEYAKSYPEELGGTIVFSKSLQGQTITLSGGQLEIKQGITIDASSLYTTSGTPGVTIDAGGKSRVFYVSRGTVDAPILLKGLRIANGGGVDAGGAIYVAKSGTLTLENCFIANNNAKKSGGGVYVDAGKTTFTNSLMNDNSATTSGGGLYAYAGETTFRNSTISGNTAGMSGGGARVLAGVSTVYAFFYNTIVALNKASKPDYDDISNGGVTIEAYNALSSFTKWINDDGYYYQYKYDASLSLFKNPAKGDYALAADSQAIDGGNNSSPRD